MQLNGTVELCLYDIKCIEQAMIYVEEHYSERMSIEGLSMEVGLSIRKLQAGLKGKTGYTLHEYILQVRVDRAKQMLMDTVLPLKSIAKAVGFRTASHFGEVFKSITSMTPNEYRYSINSI